MVSLKAYISVLVIVIFATLAPSSMAQTELVSDDLNNLVDTKSVHADNSVMFIAGQSREEFGDYLEEVCGFAKHCPNPAGAAIYTSLNGNGLRSPHSNALGDNHQDLWYLLNVYKPLVLQVALWLANHELASIADGSFDTKVNSLIDSLKDTDRPVFLRIGYEFDGPHNRYKPQEFVSAYRVIAKAARRSKNIKLVWHSFAMLPTYQARDVTEWYPGDRFVDWVGISFFQATEAGYHTAPNRDRLIKIAEQIDKPVMITEASAIRYTADQEKQKSKEYWDYWYKPFFELIESTPSIRAVSMINVDWTSQKQHVALDWGDARIQSDDYVLKRWRQKMQQPYWFFSQAKQSKYLLNIDQ
jgi:hypothetical protein